MSFIRPHNNKKTYQLINQKTGKIITYDGIKMFFRTLSLAEKYQKKIESQGLIDVELVFDKQEVSREVRKRLEKKQKIRTKKKRRTKK